MTEQYNIDGLGFFEQYGVTILEGSDEFNQPHKRKEPVQFDWGDENGIEYDLSNPCYLPRQFNLIVLIEGDSEVDFKIKFNALITRLTMPGTIEIENLSNGETVNVFCSQWQQVEDFNTGSKYYRKASITFNEVVGAFLNTLLIDGSDTDNIINATI